MNARANPYAAEIAAETLKLSRAPEFMAPTLILPIVFYTLFAVVMQPGGDTPTYMLATFGVFAVMGPALFGFGAGVAQERERGWLRIKRAAPAPAASLIMAKTVATLMMAGLALALIYAAAAFAAGVELSPGGWALLALIHLGSTLPFVFAGLAIGFLTGSNAAIAIANLLFLGFAVLGGLWIPVMAFPDVLQQISWTLPSFHLAEIALSVVDAGQARPVGLHLAAAGAWTVGLATLAGFAWLRQR